MEPKKNGSIWSMFTHADRTDAVLMALGVAGCIGDGITMPLTLLITSSLMNDIGSHGFNSNSLLIQSINRNAVLLCYVASGSWFLCFLEGYCWTRAAERQAARMRMSCLGAVLRQDVAFFDLNDTTTSEIVTVVANDTLSIQDCLSEKVPNFLMNIMSFIGSQVAAFLMLWKLAIVELPFVTLLVIPGLLYSRTLMGLARKLRDEYKRAGSIVEQAISSIRTVYAFGGEQGTMSKFSAALEGSVKLGLKQGLAKGVAIGSNGLILAVAAFNCWYGSRLILNNEAKGGTVFAVGAEIAVGGFALGSALSNIRYLSEAASAGERIMEIIKRVPEIDADNPNGKVLETVKGAVEFKHVKFKYPSRPETPVLQDFSLKIPTGSMVALVGKSGCGKSTVISLLQRFYNPLGGEILLDGVSIDKIQLKWLRSQMGMVSQEPSLFAMTIKENILFGKEDASMEEVVEAAKASNAHSFITQLPQGYDTEVGERGVQVSGGQKQRIAIARAIIRKPQILLLDEATSALDSKSEQVVQDALDKASMGRTTVVIAHRLSTIRNSDTIVVIEDGQITQIGSHGELIAAEDGLYSSLVQSQEMMNEPNGIAMRNQYSQVNRSSSASSSDSIHGSVAEVQIGKNNNRELKAQDDLPVPSFRRLLALNLPEWKQASLGCLSAVLFGAVQPVYAFVMGSMIAVFFSTNREEVTSKTRIYIISVVGLAICSLVVNISQHYNFAYMGEYLTKRVRERMLSKIFTFEIGWFDQEENSTGAICSGLARDANVVRSLVGDRISLFVQTFSAIIIACAMGLIIAWKLAVVMIAVQPLIIASYYTRRVLIKSMSEKAIKAHNASSSLAAEAISNIRTVTSFSSQLRILRLLEKTQEGPRRENVRQSWYAGLGLAFAQGIMTCTWALDFWYGGRLVAYGVIDARALFETFMILVSTGKVIADTGSMTSDLAKGANAVKSAFGILDRVTQIHTDCKEGYQPETMINGHVSFHKVRFAYPARPEAMVLKDLSLDVRAGKSTALVGQSGSGKSTIISLIERFYDPVQGTVKIDGHDLRSFHLRTLRRHIALVSQEPSLFSGTIRENILYGAGDKVDEAEMVAAAKAANAHDFVSGLQDGYSTLCGDRGTQLSGGQKQRVAIARAILRNPKILLLDEATSALDGEAEKAVQDALERVMVGRTSVVVAHRLSTVVGRDVIVVLGRGRVLEEGTHSSLLAMGGSGAYYSMVNLQRSSNPADGWR